MTVHSDEISKDKEEEQKEEKKAKTKVFGTNPTRKTLDRNRQTKGKNPHAGEAEKRPKEEPKEEEDSVQNMDKGQESYTKATECKESDSQTTDETSRRGTNLLPPTKAVESHKKEKNTQPTPRARRKIGDLEKASQSKKNEELIKLRRREVTN